MATDLQWVEVSDFRPGIYARTQAALGAVGLPAPLGSAQGTNTYRCFALPGGGLAPLPRQTQTFAITDPEAGAPISGYYIVGAIAHGPISVGTGTQTIWSDSLFVSVAYQIAAGTQQRHRLYRLECFASPFAFTTLRTINSGSAENFFEPSWMMTNRASGGAATTPGNPYAGIMWEATAGASDRYIAMFPNPAAPGVEALLLLSTVRSGYILGHQGRLVLLERSGYSFGNPGGSSTNEQISFTDPPNSVTLGSQQQVFVQEYPNGFATAGSISAGELFLVKQQGGGLIVSGDLAYPTLTRLPGVISGGGVTSKPAASRLGLIYGSRHDGPALWSGGNSSQPVAKQLDPNNFFPIAAAPGNVLGGTNATNMMQVYEAWGQFVYCTNNWVLDVDGGGWWLAEDRSVKNFMHWTRGYNGRNMYGLPSGFTHGTGAVVVYAFDYESPALSYSWQGHPVIAGIQNRLLTVREIVLIAEGSGTVVITLTKLDGTTQSETFTITNTTQPQRLRLTTACKCYSVIPRIVSDGGSSPAPIVHKISFGYEESVEATAA